MRADYQSQALKMRFLLWQGVEFGLFWAETAHKASEAAALGSFDA